MINKQYRNKYESSQYGYEQYGFLLMAMIIVMLLVTILSVMVVRIVLTHNQDTLNQQYADQAFYIASSGLQRASYQVKNGLSCSAVNGDHDLTDVAVANGHFTVNASYYQPINTTLTRAINAQSSVISVSSIAGYAPTGWLYIDNELIYYGLISFSTIDCQGRIPCFTDLRRAVGGTFATSHSNGSQIEQRQCDLTATGVVDTFSSPRAVQRLMQHIDIVDLDGNGDHYLFNSWHSG